MSRIIVIVVSALLLYGSFSNSTTNISAKTSARIYWGAVLFMGITNSHLPIVMMVATPVALYFIGVFMRGTRYRRGKIEFYALIAGEAFFKILFAIYIEGRAWTKALLFMAVMYLLSMVIGVVLGHIKQKAEKM